MIKDDDDCCHLVIETKKYRQCETSRQKKINVFIKKRESTTPEQNLNYLLKLVIMDSSAEAFFNSIENENNSLTIQVNNLESEKINLSQQVVNLEKALDKQKKFHRKYVEEVTVTEKLRIDDFKEEKRSLTEQNKLLNNQIRQLTKDLHFFKNAYEEVNRENDEIAFYKTAYEELMNDNKASTLSRATRMSASSKGASSRAFSKSLVRTPSAVPAPALETLTIGTSERKYKSSKVLSQLSEKLLMENKKLKIKVDRLNETVRVLKAKNKSLESFKRKIDNKKLEFGQNSAELKNLLALTEKKNRTTYTPEILSKLGELSLYKIST